MSKICSLYYRVIYCLQKLSWVPSLLARISVGSIFVVSGWGKLHNFEKVIGFFTDLGIPFPAFNGHLVALTEFGGGFLILLGLLTRLASIPLTITMVVAIITAKTSDIHSVTDLLGLDEFIYIVFFVWFVINGAGKASLDHFISRKCNRHILAFHK